MITVEEACAIYMATEYISDYPIAAIADGPNSWILFPDMSGMLMGWILPAVDKSTGEMITESLLLYETSPKVPVPEQFRLPPLPRDPEEEAFWAEAEKAAQERAAGRIGPARCPDKGA